MERAQPRASDDTHGNYRGGNTCVLLDNLCGENTEYGDEGFESEDLSPSHGTSGVDGFWVKAEKRGAVMDSASIVLDKSSEAEKQISSSTSDAGVAELEGAQQTYVKGVNVKQEGNGQSGVSPLSGGEHKVQAGRVVVESNQGGESKDTDQQSPKTQLRDNKQGGDNTGTKKLHSGQRQASDEEDEDYFHLQVDDNFDPDEAGLDMDFQTCFQEQDGGRSPQSNFFLSTRDDETEYRRNDESTGVLSPPIFAPPEVELTLRDQLSRLQVHGDRCTTRGRQNGPTVREAESRRVKQRAQSQEDNGQRRRRISISSSHMDAGGAAKVRRERQERLIQQLTRANGMLQRKVAGYQLALQLSADEDDFAASPSFSAALKLQQAAPPAPRDGGTPAPSPRVARGWTHMNPLPTGRKSTIERNLSYTTLVRQLDAGGRRTRMLKQANEALGERVNELESGAVLRATQSRLSEREEEIFALREELSVVNRMARAQDRKFEGSQGHALARRLWLAEEELRLARSTISTLGAELYGLRQHRRAQGQDARQPGPRRPVRRRRPSHEDEAARSPRIKRQEQGTQGAGAGAGGRSPTTAGLDRSGEATGASSGGRNVIQPAHGKASAGKQGQAVRNQRVEVKAEVLQQALANMRSKAKGELRAARIEIDGLKGDKAALGKALEIKGKEIRMQLLQVNRLKRQLRDLSAGAIKLEEASCVVSSASIPFRTRGIASAAATAAGGGASARAGGQFGVATVKERRVKSAAVAVGGSADSKAADADIGRASLSSLAAAPGAPPHRSDASGSVRHGSSSPMGWNRDWAGDDAVVPGAPAMTPAPLVTTTREAERELLGSHAGVARREGGFENADEVQDVKENEVPATPEAKGLAAPAGANTKRNPCPLAGILDMVEPPLRGHRRSFYNENDGKVYQLAPESYMSSVDLVEARKESVRLKCVIDFQGIVQHGEDCILRDVPRKVLPCERNGLHSEQESEGQPLVREPTIPLSVGVPCRTWKDSSESDLARVGRAGLDSTERLQLKAKGKKSDAAGSFDFIVD